MELSGQEKKVFDAINEGILIIDTEGTIVFGNAAYRRFLNREAGGDVGDIAGYPLLLLRPGARLPEVLKTRRPILQAPRREENDIYFVNMYPIFDTDGETLLGGISVVTFREDAKAFQTMLKDVETRSRQMLRQIGKADATFETVVAHSEKSRESKQLALRFAGIDAPVLLTGEAGTAKSVYAQAIHNAGARRGVFSVVSCASQDPEALDAELFGRAGGVRSEGQIGLLEAADGGTVFLDEITALRPESQARLLSVLTEHSVRPMGGGKDRPVNVRVIAATSAEVQEELRAGRLRADLYYTLSIFRVHLPPLRERMEDLPYLTRLLLGELSAGMKRRFSIAEDAMERLRRHSWPGNIRELQNVLEFSAWLSPDGVIRAEHLPEHIGLSELRDASPLHDRVRRFERAEIRKALEYYGDDLKGKKAAAAELGISLASLYGKLKEEA